MPVNHFLFESIPMKNIATAFVAAKRAFGPALKTSQNPHLKNKYAGLGECLEAVDEALLANGIALMQETFEDAGGITIETVFLHESGEVLRCGKLHVPAAKQDAQGFGSALTYARRYSLMTACGIAPEDDDGNAASKPAQQGAKQPAQDDSPKARAARLAAGVLNGDAEGAAQFLSALPDADTNKIWAHLDAETQKRITAAWPVAA
jgi:hypothetical protein